MDLLRNFIDLLIDRLEGSLGITHVLILLRCDISNLNNIIIILGDIGQVHLNDSFNLIRLVRALFSQLSDF
ncbi:hypothetical protein D3C85_1833240 [compost metagenome]